MYAYVVNKRKGSPEASPLTRTERAYLAGIIDGEGSIGVYKRSPTGPNYFLKLAVYNTFEALITWLTEHLGGATVFMRNDPPNQRPSWSWTIYGANALRVIRLARPYMIVKAKQADLAEEFMATLVDNRRVAVKPKVVPPEQLAQRVKFYEQMSALNRPHQFRKGGRSRRD